MKRTFDGVVGPVMSTNYFMFLTLIMFVGCAFECSETICFERFKYSYRA